MKSLVLTVGGLLGLCLPAAAQEWIETRFDRVHLRNGNVVDGSIITKTPTSVTLRIVGGEITFRASYIDRIELVKIKSLKEPAIIIEKPKTDTVTPTQPKVTPKTPDVKADVRKSVADIVRKWRAASKDARFEVGKELIPLGPEAALYLIATIDSFSEAEIQLLVEPAVGELKPDGAAALLAPSLSSPKPHLRAGAATLIGAVGDSAHNPAITGLLKDADARVRFASMAALHKLGAKESIEAIAELGLDADQNLRTTAFSMVTDLCLKNDRSNDLVFIIGRILERATGGAKADAALALGRTAKKEAAEPLMRVLGDDDPNVRSMALVSLANLDAKQASTDVLDRMRAERDNGVRGYLATAAEKLKIRKAIPILIQWMSDSDSKIQGTAVVALRAMTSQNFGVDAAAWQAWWDGVKGDD